VNTKKLKSKKNWAKGEKEKNRGNLVRRENPALQREKTVVGKRDAAGRTALGAENHQVGRQELAA